MSSPAAPAPRLPGLSGYGGEIASAFQATSYHLLEELQAYIHDRDPRRPQRGGARYAEQAVAAGLALGDLLRAFLHFGGYLLESVFRMVEMGGSPEHWHEVHRAIMAFYNETLLTMIERYLEQAPWPKATAGFSAD